MQQKNRFRFATKQIPGTARFSVQVVEVKDGEEKKKRKTKKEKRRIRNMFKKLEEESEEKKIEKDSVSIKPSYKLYCNMTGSKK